MTSPPRAPSRWRSCSSTAWTRAWKGCEASTFAHTARGVAAFDLATFRLIFPICRHGPLLFQFHVVWFGAITIAPTAT